MNLFNKRKPFGLHLMMDMYNCDPKSLDDKDLVQKELDTLPGKMGMRKLIDPVVLFAQPNGIKDPGGWSGFVMIQESHISIHTFIKRRFVTIDVYSCKEFDPKPIIEHFKKLFKTKDVELEVVVRGKKYPPKDLED